MITLSELRTARGELARKGGLVGFVPTMGYLHTGHLSLVEQARTECAAVVVSIFVNPAQFGPHEDLDAYPRNLPGDLDMLAQAGVDLVWTPTAAAMYPPGYQTWVTYDAPGGDVPLVTAPLEGSMRPGHFRGVATVVAKLFNAVQPDKAYFGQKDAQQVVAIQQMVRDLNFPLEIVVCPTRRERDGLAMSSRNSYLSPAERQAAGVLYRALSAARSAFDQGETNPARLREMMREVIAAEPLARLQYVSCAHPDTLVELDSPIAAGPAAGALFSLAVFVGKTRLIDNFLLRAGVWMTGQ